MKMFQHHPHLQKNEDPLQQYLLVFHFMEPYEDTFVGKQNLNYDSVQLLQKTYSTNDECFKELNLFDYEGLRC